MGGGKSRDWYGYVGEGYGLGVEDEGKIRVIKRWGAQSWGWSRLEL